MNKFFAFLVLIVFIGSFCLSCEKQANELIIKIPLVTWGGYAALFAANNGPEPTENSLFYKYGGFKVELVQIEDPSLHLQGFSNGTYNIIWSTMDMIPLQYDSLSKDPRTIPQVIGLFDYSAGGDGIIVRAGITKAQDMVGKKVVVPQYQPSHYFFLWYLNMNNLQPKDVEMIYAEDAIKAKDTYINDSSIDVCVTWSPFIYDITDPAKSTYIKGSHLLITTAIDSPAHGVIADVYVARADFVQKNPGVIKAFTRAMLEGNEIYLNDKEKIAVQIAGFFGIPGGKDEAMLMFNDVVIGGKQENKDFFFDKFPFSGYHIFNRATELYKLDGKLNPDFNPDPATVLAPAFMLEAIAR
jgi:ABC-type nitrate/sulfonate/bicarbonate transport system substrate-binding protein